MQYDSLSHIILDKNIKRATFIDIVNIENLFKSENLKKYVDFYNKFNYLDNYLEKYELLKINFPNELKEKKEIFVLPKNEKIYQILKNELFRINDIYYIKLKIFQFNYFEFNIIKDISIDKNNFNY